MSPPSPSTQLPVLIIGSGMGGLTLAHSLSKHSIPYRLFERDPSHSQRAQGYRFGIDGGGADGLRSALSPALFETFEKTCAEQHPPGGRVDGPSGKLVRGGVVGLLGAGGWGMIWALARRYLGKRWEGTRASWAQWLMSWVGGPSAPTPLTLPAGENRRYQVDRRVLRSVLLTSQSPHITYDSSFTSYSLLPDSVIAHFTNGTSVAGSLLVGADGVRSKVASQLIGDTATPLDLGVRLVYGKTPLTPEVEEGLHPTLQKGTSFVTDLTPEGHKILMVMEAIRFNHPSAPENYVFWAVSAKQEAFGQDEDSAPPSSSADAAAKIAERLTAKWDPRIRLLIDRQDADQTAVLRMTSSDPNGLVEWKTERRVTVLGDAVHCMPPTGGQGANTAMWDGALLGEALAAGYTQGGDEGGRGRGDGAEKVNGSGGSEGIVGMGGWSEGTIRAYEEGMRGNIGDVVGMACIGAAGIIGAAPVTAIRV